MEGSGYMKKTNWKISLISILLFFAPIASYAAETPIQLTIESKKTIYKTDEDIIITVNLANKSDKEMIVFWNNQKAAIISDKIGIISAILPFNKTDTNENIETIYIKKNETVAKTVNIKNDLKPRQYRLTFEYRFPNIVLDYKIRQDQEIFMDTLVSNTVAVKVVEM
jgi:hypothetical protein